VFTQPVMQSQSFSGFGQVLEIQIDSDGDDIRALIGRTGVTTGTATDVQNLKPGFHGKPVKFDGDHR
jgi:hypothetical protein